MYTRTLERPDRSFFLFGPRGTGKTTWLKSVLADAFWVNLLHDRELLRFMRDPSRFTQEVEALQPGTWIVVDEVQRLPTLLNEVHGLIATHAKRYRFALTGSSARKLRRGDANLLAGRTVNRSFFPLTASEMGKAFRLADVLRFGSLPAVASENSERDRIDLLEAYASNYLLQEVRQEALVKNLDSFSRFLTVAALANAQVTNVASIARDAGVARPTVQGYFEILIDTLIGFWLPAWRPRAKMKEIGHPKFYFFDTGAVRALGGQLHDPVGKEESGRLLETYILHELRAHQNNSGCGGTLYYWRTAGGSEVDFIWSRGNTGVGIEVKSSERWRREDRNALNALREAGVVARTFAVYTGTQALKDGSVEVLPVRQFLEKLAAGKILC